MGLILLIILVLIFAGGIGNFPQVGGYGYGMGHGGIGVLGIICVVVLILLVMGRI